MLKVCIEVLKLNISGNMIPQTWFNHIKRGKLQKPDLVAMWLLSDILYWYKPIEVRDELSGNFIEYKKKFKENKLQKSYDSYSNLLGIPKKTIKEHFKLLKDLGLISIEFRNIELENGLKLSNVMYVEPCIKEIEKITYESENKSIPMHQKGTEGIYQKGIHPPIKKGNTNTETTTKNTNTENKKEKKEKKDFFSSLLGLEDIRNLLKELEVDDNFLSRLIKHRRDIKKPLKTEKMVKGLLNAIIQCKKIKGLKADKILEILEEKGWASIKPEWIRESKEKDYELDDLKMFGYKNESDKFIDVEVLNG